MNLELAIRIVESGDSPNSEVHEEDYFWEALAMVLKAARSKL